MLRQEVFSYFVEIAVYIHIMIFYFMFILSCRQSDVSASVSSPVTTKQAIIVCRCHGIDENPRQGLINGVKDSGDNLSLVTTTPAIIIAIFNDTGEQQVAHISANFCKNSK
jgi:hypothetical protein